MALWGEEWSGFWGGSCDFDKYRILLQNLLPTGPAWTRDGDATITAFLEALGVEYATVECRTEALLREADVRTTGELLDEWEAFAGLPGDCISPPTTSQGRNDALYAQVTKRQSSSLPSLAEIAERLGYTSVVIREDSKPFRVGFSAVGDALQSGPWVYHWTVIGVRPPSLSDDEQLRCLLEETAHQHTTFGLEIT